MFCFDPLSLVAPIKQKTTFSHLENENLPSEISYR